MIIGSKNQSLMIFSITVTLSLILQLNFPLWSGSILVAGTQDYDYRERDFAAVVWTPLQVFRPMFNIKGEQEVIVSIPAGRIDAGNILGIMGPSGCGKVNSE